eukprot:842089-Pelagomonas_calceolata.AAC.1
MKLNLGLMCAMEEDMLFIWTSSSASQRSQFKVWEDLSCYLIAKGVNTESKSSHAVNDIMGEVEEHAFGETVGRMHNQGTVCRGSAPLVIGQAFTVALFWAHKSAASVWKCGSVPNHPWLTEYGRTNNYQTLSSAAWLQTTFSHDAPRGSSVPGPRSSFKH